MSWMLGLATKYDLKYLLFTVRNYMCNVVEKLTTSLH